MQINYEISICMISTKFINEFGLRIVGSQVWHTWIVIYFESLFALKFRNDSLQIQNQEWIGKFQPNLQYAFYT